MREHAHYSRVSGREREKRGLLGGEGEIRTPETLSSLHAFQACALNRARPPLRARTRLCITPPRGATCATAAILSPHTQCRDRPPAADLALYDSGPLRVGRRGTSIA